eukprot:TRINITY_DN2498_c0_g2_i1.p1 TRINITY_DN2498_c0_g2~~TRINITY_DN2498_c0_g2_i1.p1  ORF type:complete len:741 (-),score=195.11 TRINITY_DN2498_c0_g2_i1:95-2317(-)
MTNTVIDTSYDNGIRNNRLILCPIVLAACVFMFVLYYKSASIRAPPCRLIVFRFLCETVYITLLFLSAIFEYGTWENIYFYAGVKVMLTGSICWTLSSVLDVVFIGRNPFKADRYFHWFHLGSWGGVVVYFLYIRARYEHHLTNQTHLWAMIDLNKEIDEQQAYFNLVFVAATLVLLLVVAAELSNGLTHTLLSRQKVKRQLVVLVCGFAVSDIMRAALWLPSTDWKLEHAEKTDLAYLLATVWDAQVWLFTTQVYSRICCTGPELDPASPNRKGNELAQSSYLHHSEEEDLRDFGDDMRHELVLRTAVGISWCAQQTLKKFTHSGASSEGNCARYSDLLERSLDNGVTKEDFHQAGLDSNFDSIVRRLSAEDAAPAEQKERLSFEEFAASPTWAEDSPDSAEDNTAGVSSTGGLRPMIKVPGDKRPLQFYDYEDALFTGIRQKLGVTALEYYEAFAAITDFVNVNKNGVHKFENSKFKEIVSSGASGSYFYFTPCRRFIVKQISRGEKFTLANIAQDYFKHCSTHPDTIIHYYGLYSIRLPLCSSGKIYFVVMKNFMYLAHPQYSINLTFDLKGATTNRERFASWRERDQLQAGAKGSSLLDWDWMKTDQILDVHRNLKRRLFCVVRKDLVFLSSMHLIDYSILLGVTKQHRAASLAAQHTTGDPNPVFSMQTMGSSTTQHVEAAQHAPEDEHSTPQHEQAAQPPQRSSPPAAASHRTAQDSTAPVSYTHLTLPTKRIV